MNESNSNTISLDVKKVNHHFGEGESRNQVLYNIGLTINRGEIVIMTGPSGSGKTTLLTLIGALRSVQHGSIKLFGKELRGLSSDKQIKMRQNIGFIFQAHNLFDSLSACDNVQMALELKKVERSQMKRKAIDILTKLGLAERVNYKPAKLSGGQRQRVAIARAIVNRPGLILADEPTAALDKDTGKEVINLLKNLAKNNGSTIMIVTHDNRILNAADRIVNMIDGTISSNVDIRRAQFICAHLKKCKLFKRASTAQLLEISDKMEVEEYDDGQNIVRKGDSGEKFYLIESGAVTIIVHDEDSNERIVNTLRKEDYFGESALLTGVRNATVRSAGKTILYSLTQRNLLDAIARTGSLGDELNKVISVR